MANFYIKMTLRSKNGFIPFLVLISFLLTSFSMAIIPEQGQQEEEWIVSPKEKKGLSTANYLAQPFYIDKTVQKVSLLIANLAENSIEQNATFQLLTHGRPGHLLMEGEWKNASEIAQWLQANQFLKNKTQLNIYGCNFAQGEKGRAAVAYLEATLGISVAASDDLTGADGDWDLEVGDELNRISILDYPFNLQTPPWPLSTNPADGNSIILHRGIAPITCGVTADLPASQRWIFAMISLNDAIPGSGRVETTNTDSVYHHNSWLVSQIGNVFGIDINETTGAVYITASSNYGAGFGNINGTTPSVLNYGSIGGATQTEAAGAVYRIDPTTGQATLFASLPQQTVTITHEECETGNTISRPNTGVGLGNITWDKDRDQYF